MSKFCKQLQKVWFQHLFQTTNNWSPVKSSIWPVWRQDWLVIETPNPKKYITWVTPSPWNHLAVLLILDLPAYCLGKMKWGPNLVLDIPTCFLWSKTQRGSLGPVRTKKKSHEKRMAPMASAQMAHRGSGGEMRDFCDKFIWLSLILYLLFGANPVSPLYSTVEDL